jgi:dihydrofolate reductase
MKTAMIVAIGKNGEIGKNNQLLWRLSDDLKKFKSLTSGNIVVMGRKTFQSIGKALPSRENVVISRNKDFSQEGIHVFSSLTDVLNRYKNDERTIFIIGGGEIYRQALASNIIQSAYITYVDGDFEADTFFPDFNEKEWKKVEEEFFEKNEKNEFNFRFVSYVR